MKREQLQAGFVLDSIRDFLHRTYPSRAEDLDSLLKSLSFFDLQSEAAEHYGKTALHPLLQAADNLVSRGLPTRCSLGIERQINDLMAERGVIVKQDEDAARTGSIRYQLSSDDSFAYDCYRALHIINPTMLAKEMRRGFDVAVPSLFDSDAEREFLFSGVPSSLPESWIQLVECQRPVQSILRRFLPESSRAQLKEFTAQRVDFSLEFPYISAGVNGLIFEIDGSQHAEQSYTILDKKRDNALSDAAFATYRIPAQDASAPQPFISNDLLEELSRNGYLQIIDENYNAPLFSKTRGRLALYATLAPYLCARIQKTLLHMMIEGELPLEADSWSIAIIERDISCSEMAVKDLEEQLNALIGLAGLGVSLPQIELKIRKNRDYAFDESTVDQNTTLDSETVYDALIDCSILDRSYPVDDKPPVKARSYARIRSSYSPSSQRRLYATGNICYSPLGETRFEEDGEHFFEYADQVDRLRILLRNIFRKDDFRPGQVQIMNRSLQCKSVIGLLPTGSGKSITYQLSALLQPGTAIVVDPLKSLMKDQYDGLLNNRIDCVAYINSSLSAQHRKLAEESMRNGELLFAFISPERFQIEEFRRMLRDASSVRSLSFSYCVIDEAHCVSEWGHDFRTSYLRLGENARAHCKSMGLDEIPMMGLTATASYDVLADIQRELGIQGEDAIVRLEDLSRPELRFHIREIDIPEANLRGATSSKEARKIVGLAKQRVLDDELLHCDPTNNPTIVFCPHKKGYFGVRPVRDNIINQPFAEGFQTAVYSGGSEDEDADVHERENADAQSGFLTNKINLLVATKAFGMGIDKPNIRNIVHLSYPSSIESYYQEAGRAGRDKNPADCTILFCGQRFPALENRTVDSALMRSFHSNSFKGIDYEKVQLFELLDAIHFPRKCERDAELEEQVEALLYDDYDLGAQCRITVNKNGRKVMYVNPGLGTFYLDKSPSFPYYPKDGTTGLPSEQVDAIRELLGQESDGSVIKSSSNEEGRVDPGIEKRLEGMEIGERIYSFAIPFENDVADVIADILRQAFRDANLRDDEITARRIREEAQYCVDLDDFNRKLGRIAKDRNAAGKLPASIDDAFGVIKGRKLLYKMRDVQSTMKSVYRLCILGIVDDYSVDYRSEIISATITKHSDEYYVDQIRRYLSRYFSTERVDNDISKLNERKGNTVIQKCFNLLMEVIYQEIAQQRSEAISAMEEACRIGVREGSGKRFEEFMMLYMNSRYARREYLPKDTDNGRIEDFGIVLKYARLVREERGGEINNLKHLRGAATMMLAQRTDNYVFLLLRALSVLVLDKGNEESVDSALGDYVRGMRRMRASKSMTDKEKKTAASQFRHELEVFDSEAAKPLDAAQAAIEDAEIHERHLKWLKEYVDLKL